MSDSDPIDPVDEIRKRLNRLKKFNSSRNQKTITDNELKERLNRLKGVDELNDESKSSNQFNYSIPNKFKSDVEQSDDLFRQLCDEAKIDDKFEKRYKKEDEELMNRLSNLRINKSSKDKNSSLISTDKINNNNDDNERVDNERVDNERVDNEIGINENFVSKSYDRTDIQNNQVMTDEELARELSFLKDQMKEFNYEFKDLNKNHTSKQSFNGNQFGNVFGKNSNNASTSKNQFESKKTKINFDHNLESDSSEEEEQSYMDVINKLSKEAELEKLEDNQMKTNKLINIRDFNLSKHEAEHDESSNDDDEIDFCYICNEDCVLECKDCEDRYCLSCFKEFHQDPEYRNHKYIRFNQKKTK